MDGGKRELVTQGYHQMLALYRSLPGINSHGYSIRHELRHESWPFAEAAGDAVN